MKAEQRKAVETNSVTEQLGRVYEGIKQSLSRSTLFYLGIAVAILVIVLLFRWFSHSSAATASHRWHQLDLVVFPEQLDEVLQDKDLEGTRQGMMALFLEARLKLGQGLRDLASSPPAARENIDSARQIYEKLLTSAGKYKRDVPLLYQEALLGAAKANEALGEIDEAVTDYKRLVEEYPDSALAADAKKQIERLETEKGRKEARELAKALAPKK